MPQVNIRLNAAGYGEVLVDGRLIPTAAIGVTSEAGEATEVTLVLAPCDVDIEVVADDAHLFQTERS